MQLLAGKTVLRQGFSRYRCSNRRPLLALTHRLCPDSRQTAQSNCRHYCPVNRHGRMRLHGQRSIQLAMGAKSVVVLGGLQCKITSRLIKKRPLAKRDQAKVVNPVARFPPDLLRVAASSNQPIERTLSRCALQRRSSAR
jgi:hypothetical protein